MFSGVQPSGTSTGVPSSARTAPSGSREDEYSKVFARTFAMR